jgi:hypothetical protein
VTAPRAAAPAGAWSQFVRDLGWSLRTARSALGFVGVVVVLSGAKAALPPLWWPLFVLVLLFLAGFAGTEWLFYLQRADGKRLTFSDGLGATWHYVRPFTRLGIVSFTPYLLVYGFVVASQGRRTGWQGFHFHAPGWWIAFSVGYTVVLDMLLTFVTPSLASSTDFVFEAIPEGLRELRSSWPRSVWYALAPGLTLTLIALPLPRSAVGTAGGAAIGIVGGLVGFLFKGAIAAFYIRQFGDPRRRSDAATSAER